MKIALSGTPGTGKTTVAKILARNLNYSLLSLNEFAKSHKLTLGNDKKRNSVIVDVSALKKEVAQMEGNIILEGHLAHFCDADIYIILRTNPKELRKRMKTRVWSEEKIRENVEAEIMNICLDEAVELHGKAVFEVDTAKKSAEEVAKIIEEIIAGKKREKYAPGKIDWTEHIK
ncbi:MAG: adenylate kinase family protein [Nanoarchaeota archaeon]|nr:adenylate kinase family protein [Nanoarchaeota archaeon]MBU4299890.1 adenylate kinase family protein [Nanoarchaeota archaeon]MBU4452331.1 adenylate kinase family protein [Nanoarchaeota archaeon]MCG2724545.1 adenylate kinase family protein [archaeon]